MFISLERAPPNVTNDTAWLAWLYNANVINDTGWLAWLMVIHSMHVFWFTLQICQSIKCSYLISYSCLSTVGSCGYYGNDKLN